MADFITAIGLQGLEEIGNVINSQIQYKQTKKLMDIQQQNQMELNRQGQEIQLDTWSKTNYPAQIEMLKKAGLNPSLMYSKGGVGGTTGGQTGGSASMGQAPQRKPMEIGNILALQNISKQNALTEAQKLKTEAETKEIEARTPKYATEIGKLIAETTNEEIKGRLMTIEMALKQSDTDKAIQETINLKTQNALTEAQFNDIVKMTNATAIGKTLENTLTQEKINLTQQQITEIKESIAQKWVELDIRNVGTNQKNVELEQRDKEIAIQKFRAEVEAITQPLGKVAGKFINEIVNDLNNISAKVFNQPTPRDYTKVNYK